MYTPDMYTPDQFVRDVLTTTANAVEQDLPPTQLQTAVGELVAKFLQPATPVLKFDEDQHMVWGWASVAVEKGEPVHDLQDDLIDIAELQKAAHEFVVHERVSKEQHTGPQVGTVVDSIVFTKEVQQALGINLGREGWYVGVKVDDPRVWARVKKGELAMFSVGGEGERHPVAKAQTFSEVVKAQTHGPDGKFTSGGGDDPRPPIGAKVTVTGRDQPTKSQQGVVTGHVPNDPRITVKVGNKEHLMHHSKVTVNKARSFSEVVKAAKLSDIEDAKTGPMTFGDVLKTWSPEARQAANEARHAAAKTPDKTVSARITSPHSGHEYEVQHNGSRAFVRNLTAPNTIHAADVKSGFHSSLNSTKFGFSEKLSQSALQTKLNALKVKKASSLNELIGKTADKDEQAADEAAKLARESAAPIPHAPGSEKQRAQAIAAHGKAHTHLTTEQSLSLLTKRTKVPLSSDETEAHMKAHLAAGGKRDQAVVAAEQEAEQQAKEKERHGLGMAAE
jgi:hypothetical protein